MIIGCGRLGATLANVLLDRGDAVVILDTNPENFRRLRPRPTLSMFVGDGSTHETLRRAGVETSETFVAVTGQDTTNALSAQLAQISFGVQSVICRVNDPIRSVMYEQLGLKTISPTEKLASLAFDAMGY